MEDKKELSLYGAVGEAINEAETAFCETLQDNDIDMSERQISLKIEVFEIIDDLDGKKIITLGKIDSTLRAIK